MNGEFWTVVGSVAGVVAALLAFVQIRVANRAHKSSILPQDSHDESESYPVAPPVGTLPLEVVGREELLDRIASELRKDWKQPQILTGIGGSGKSTVALAIGKLARQRGWAVWWIRGDSTELFIQGAQSLLAQLGEKSVDGLSGSTILARVFEILEEGQNWILILDNVDNPGDLAWGSGPVREGNGWVRAASNGLVLVTSREASTGTWGNDTVVHEMPPLPDDAAAKLLINLAPHAGNKAEACDLARELYNFPLALHQAGSHLSSQLTQEDTFVDYMNAFKSMGAFVLLSADSANARAAVQTSWELSLRSLDEAGTNARNLLYVLACFHSSTIAPELLAGVAFKKPKVFLRLSRKRRKLTPPRLDISAIALRRDISALSSVGLLRTVSSSDTSSAIRLPTVQLHPLVQQVTWESVHNPASRAAARRCAEVAEAACNAITVASRLLTIQLPDPNSRTYASELPLASSSWLTLYQHYIEVLYYESEFVDRKVLCSLLKGGLAGISALANNFELGKMNELSGLIFVVGSYWGSQPNWVIVNLNFSLDDLYRPFDSGFFLRVLANHDYTRISATGQPPSDS